MYIIIIIFLSLITPPLTSKNEIIQYTYLVKESTWHKFNLEIMEKRERERERERERATI